MLRPLTLTSLAVCALALTMGSARPGLRVQDPDEEPEVEKPADELRDIFGRSRLKDGARDPFEGTWQLLSLKAEGYPQTGMTADGYLMIVDGHIAFQMQASWDFFQAGEELDDGYQAFIAEYNRRGNTLTCTTLIGAYLDEGEDILDFEEGNFPREFLVRMSGGFLTLSWGEMSSMTFGRRAHRGRSAPDIFGRRTVPSTDGPDIFGRKRKVDEEEEEDEDEDDGR